MIQSKDDLRYYLETERRLFLHRNYGVKQLERKRPKIIGEYAKNTGGGYADKVNCVLHKIRYKILSILFCAQIPANVFDEGLLIQHLHGIIVSSEVHVGRLCYLYHNTTMGISVGTDDYGKCPVLGDGVTVCTGAVIVGDIEIADGVTIAANAVVVKSVEKASCLVGGVPAKVIKEKAGFSMLDYWATIRTLENKN